MAFCDLKLENLRNFFDIDFIFVQFMRNKYRKNVQQLHGVKNVVKLLFGMSVSIVICVLSNDQTTIGMKL